MTMNLLQKYNEYEKARSELIEDMRKLRNEIVAYIDSDHKLFRQTNFSIIDCTYDLYPNDDSIDIKIVGGNIEFSFIEKCLIDDFDQSWTFTYQPHWEGLSVEEIVADIVKQSKALFDLQRKRAIDEIKRQAEELGISVGEEGK